MARSVAPQAVGTSGLFRARRLRRGVIGLGAAALALSGMGALAPAAPATTAHQPVHELAAKRLGDRLYFSSGLLAWLRGPSAVQGEVGRAARLRAANSPGAFTPAIGGNVDANDPAEDLAAGQSESAVAAQRRGGSSLVLAAWNDIGAQLASPTTPKGSGTGIGLSSSSVNCLNPCFRAHADEFDSSRAYPAVKAGHHQ